MTPEQIAALVAELRAADFMRPPTLATAWAAADLIERLQSDASESAMQYLSDLDRLAEGMAALITVIRQVEDDPYFTELDAETQFAVGSALLLQTGKDDK